jgi:hypothetical protein
MTQSINNSNEIIDLSQLLSGTYFVALDQNGQRRVEKVVKL